MNQMVDELKSVPGVVGACVYSSSAGVMVSNLPGIFKQERLATVGKHLAKLYSAGTVNFDNLTDVSLHYDEAIVVARELPSDLLIFAICDPLFNRNLLSVSFNLLQEEIEKGDLVPPPVAEAPAAAGETSPFASAERLPDLLNDMKELLSKVVGPMAGLVFDDALELWEEQGRAEIDRIDELVTLLNEEIADLDKVERYRKLIAPKLGSLQKG